MKCEDCGTTISGGTCPSCQEELFIFENQYEYLPAQLSEEFIEKIVEQRG